MSRVKSQALEVARDFFFAEGVEFALAVSETVSRSVREQLVQSGRESVAVPSADVMYSTVYWSSFGRLFIAPL